MQTVRLTCSASPAALRRLFVGLALGLTTVLLAGHPAAAQTPGVGFTSNAFGVENNAADALRSLTGSYTLGFEFTANANATVSALGYFNDPSFDPTYPFRDVALSPVPTGSYKFAGSHAVGLYQGTTLLASATVTSDSSPFLNFLYQSITPVSLVKGEVYVLAGVTGSTDPYVLNISDDSQPGRVGLTTDGITYVQDRFDPGSTLALPTQTDAGSEPGFFGPNLMLTPSSPASVPEASSVLVLGQMAFGLTAMIAAARLRRRKA